MYLKYAVFRSLASHELGTPTLAGTLGKPCIGGCSMFHTAACKSIPGSNTANVSSRLKPRSANTGSDVGSIWMVINPVTVQVKAVPRKRSESSDAAAFVLRQRGSFLSDMSSYVSA